MKTRILVVSSANMDMTLPLESFPVAGETKLCRGSVRYSPGGKGGNSAIAFSRLGGDCVFCTKLGRDAHGESLYEFYKESGINTDYLLIDRKHPTGFAAIFVERSGQNRIMVYPGANLHLQEDEIKDAFLSFPDALYLQTEIPFDNVLTAAEAAAERGIPIFLDAGPADKNAPLEELPPLEIFSPNETETYVYTGIEPTNSDACLRAAVELSKRVKAKYYVLKLGGRGAYIYNGRRCHLLPAASVKAVDTTAAGDAFTAALTLRYLNNGGDILDAVRYANAVGGLTVSRPGAGEAIPNADEAEEYYRENAHRL